MSKRRTNYDFGRALFIFDLVEICSYFDFKNPESEMEILTLGRNLKIKGLEGLSLLLNMALTLLKVFVKKVGGTNE